MKNINKMENKQTLPLNTNIDEWNKIDNFKESFSRFSSLELFQNDDIDRIENWLYTNNVKPTILLLKVKHVRELMKCGRRFIDIIFGLKTDRKLLEIDLCDGGSQIYLHGLWYLFLEDCKFSMTKILNDDEELIFVGVNFNREAFRNSKYYMKWGSNKPIKNIYDQGIYLVYDGIITKTTTNYNCQLCE